MRATHQASISGVPFYFFVSPFFALEMLECRRFSSCARIHKAGAARRPPSHRERSRPFTYTGPYITHSTSPPHCPRQRAFFFFFRASRAALLGSPPLRSARGAQHDPRVFVAAAVTVVCRVGRGRRRS